MKLSTILAIAITTIAGAIACSPAHATCTGGAQHGAQCAASNGANSPNQNQQQHQSAHARSSSTAAAGASSIATGGTASAQGGQGIGIGGEGGQGGQSAASVTSNYAAPRIPVNTAVAGFQQTTALCRYAEGLGGQSMTAGASIGFTFKDRDCERAALAEVFYSRGQYIAGDKLMCAIKTVRKALGDETDCMAVLAESHVAVNVEPAPDPASLRAERMAAHGFPKVNK